MSYVRKKMSILKKQKGIRQTGIATKKGRTKPVRRQIMPRLDTLEMIEDAIRKEQYFESKTKLWKALPRGVQYGTLGIAIDYLEKSNKIARNGDGSLAWTFVETEKARKSLQRSTEL